jgi:hypothetical protein
MLMEKLSIQPDNGESLLPYHGKQAFLWKTGDYGLNALQVHRRAL